MNIKVTTGVLQWQQDNPQRGNGFAGIGEKSSLYPSELSSIIIPVYPKVIICQKVNALFV